MLETMNRGENIKSGTILNGYDRKNKQGYVDLKSMTAEQLNELIERQNKLLQNRFFLEKLPDKGKKIILFKTELEVELKKKQDDFEDTCQLLLSLNLTDKNAEEIEWNKGKVNGCVAQLDSDDDDDDDDDDIEDESSKEDTDLLRMIATHSGTATVKNIKKNFPLMALPVKNLKEDKKLFYRNKIYKCEISNKVTPKERFKPNQLRNNDKTIFKLSAEKLKNRLGSKWEITQATPPVPIYKDAVMISLNESLKLQKEQAERLKEIEKKHAAEKLLEKISVKMEGNLPEHNITEYRSNSNICDMSDQDKEEYEFSDSGSEEEKTIFLRINESD